MEKYLQYKMDNFEQLMSNIACNILNALNGSYKPHCFGNIHFDNNINKVVYVKNKGYLLFINGRLFNPFKKQKFDFIYRLHEFIIFVSKGFGCFDIDYDVLSKNTAVARVCNNIKYNDLILRINNNHMFLKKFCLYADIKENKKELLIQNGFKNIYEDYWTL